MKIRTSTRTTTALLAALLLAAAGCGSKGSEESAPAASTEPAPVAVETSPAAAGQIVEGIEVTGTLAPRFTAEIKSDTSGRVTAVHVTEWAKVRKGDPLATIDIEEISNNLRKADAAVMLTQTATFTAGAAVAAARANAAMAEAAAETARPAWPRPRSRPSGPSGNTNGWPDSKRPGWRPPRPSTRGEPRKTPRRPASGLPGSRSPGPRPRWPPP